jgi:hypothetical protein
MPFSALDFGVMGSAIRRATASDVTCLICRMPIKGTLKRSPDSFGTTSPLWTAVQVLFVRVTPRMPPALVVPELAGRAADFAESEGCVLRASAERAQLLLNDVWNATNPEVEP